jgi:hypothetical protein
MAKKVKKTTKAKKTKKASRKMSARADAARGASPKKVAKKPRAGRSHVSFGLHGMKEILERIKGAGLEKALNAKLKSDDLFAKVQKTSLTKLKAFIDSNAELSSLSQDTSTCNCPPNDPYCIYLG